MLERIRPRVLSAVLTTVCAGAIALACGDNGGTGSGGAGHGGGGDTTTGGAAGGDSGPGGFGGDPNSEKLTIDPPMAMLTITDKATPVKQAFTALLDGNKVSGAAWTLDSYALGDVSVDGVFSSIGIVGGTAKVVAKLGNKTATADLTVLVKLSEDVPGDPGDPPIDPANKGALGGAPEPDPGMSDNPPNPTKILYPYDKTVMPRGLVAPILQFSPGNLPPVDAKVVLSSDYFSWEGYIHVKDGNVPQFSIPQDIWDGALQSTGGKTLQVDVIKASGGKAYGPATTHIIVAPGTLKGAVYYMTYEAPQNGLYSVRPGVKEPAKLLIPGCVVCHSVSANGTHLATGADQAQFAAQSGIYAVGSDGSATQITGSPGGLGGDSRGISYATFTPDGKYVLRSQNDFWGGLNQQAWQIDDAGKQLVPAKVVGLGDAVSAYVPAISADGKRYAFTNGYGEPSPFGTPSRSISLMDLAVDAASNTLTFSNRQLVLDNGPGGSVAKFVNFLPDPNLLILQEGENYNQGYGEMLPTWGPDSNFDTSTGRLYMIKMPGKEHVELANLNAGNADIDRQRNYEPFPLPVKAGGYYWLVFTSIREYGNTYAGADARKQLWVAAISPDPAAGADPSHPPFYLPNQSTTRNERGFWALEPCKAKDQSCQSGDECCDGYCHPSDPSQPNGPKVCQPTSNGCSQDGEKCKSDADCCGAGSGGNLHCDSGFCGPIIN
jgi:hypothetical protein